MLLAMYVTVNQVCSFVQWLIISTKLIQYFMFQIFRAVIVEKQVDLTALQNFTQP